MTLNLETNTIENLPELSEEELKNRKKELFGLTDEGKNMLNQIKGKQNTRILGLDNLIIEVAREMQKGEDEDDDFISDCEYSSQFLEFVTWYLTQKSDNRFLNKYANNIDIFEDILNFGLENEDPNNIFDYLNSEDRAKYESSIQEMPLSGMETECLERFEILSTTENNLIEIFENIKDHEGDSWERFKQYL